MEFAKHRGMRLSQMGLRQTPEGPEALATPPGSTLGLQWGWQALLCGHLQVLQLHHE